MTQLPRPIDVDSLSLEDVPAFLGDLEALKARAWTRLMEPQSTTTPDTDRVLDADAAAEIAGTTRRWLLTTTRGMSMRRDLSRKQPRFSEKALRSWMASRKGGRR